MFASLARRLSMLARSRVADDGAAMDRHDATEERETGWHGSSWAIQHGVEVIELPAAAAADLFPDTQPAYHWPVYDEPRQAA